MKVCYFHGGLCISKETRPTKSNYHYRILNVNKSISKR